MNALHISINVAIMTYHLLSHYLKLQSNNLIVILFSFFLYLKMFYFENLNSLTGKNFALQSLQSKDIRTLHLFVQKRYHLTKTI